MSDLPQMLLAHLQRHRTISRIFQNPAQDVSPV
jgi:hypothetical protein